MKTKILSIALLTILVASMSLVNATSNMSSFEPLQNGPEYDPWIDLNDDGEINLYDAVMLLTRYGSKGTPINKTALLLELQSRVEALETRLPERGHVSIHPGAFSTSYWNQSFDMSEHTLRGSDSFYADIQLPNGSTILNMTVYVLDLSSEYYVNVTLGRYLLGEVVGPQTMALVTTYPPEIGSGHYVLYDDTVDYAEIDNQHCMYHLEVFFSGKYTFLAFIGVIIEYAYQT